MGPVRFNQEQNAANCPAKRAVFRMDRPHVQLFAALPLSPLGNLHVTGAAAKTPASPSRMSESAGSVSSQASVLPARNHFPACRCRTARAPSRNGLLQSFTKDVRNSFDGDYHRAAPLVHRNETTCSPALSVQQTRNTKTLSPPHPSLVPVIPDRSQQVSHFPIGLTKTLLTSALTEHGCRISHCLRRGFHSRLLHPRGNRLLK